MALLIPTWSAPPSVKAVSSTRLDGQSTGPFYGLNLGDHVGDDEINVEHNRLRFQQASGMPSSPVWLTQTHSTQVLVAGQNTAPGQQADACVTREAGIVCCVMTADCLPILLCDSKGRQVAAVHAGWRGLADGIIEKTLSHFESQTVCAWLGPCISANAFEVGDEVKATFVAHDEQAQQAFVRRDSSPGKWWADLPLLATQRLLSQGVSQIAYSNQCTYQQPQSFYSYRRDGQTGRMATAIWIEP
ncbi:MULTISPECIES: peptidoglycan editing factor PgeF [unclassified Vibrio]|uniref:Purine nucleoside phosphorylase n=1 Tax=Vibrio sp. HB236076 TaxID=3232307 RepID=A0AB39HGM4_9VIBR|nr:peptidoglycan editing factor PgeF [Vibrio sp. HB161653]MDP5254633.1 peptidoglycan editing factor PgeF [Vibrio sp. HB161653]